VQLAEAVFQSPAALRPQRRAQYLLGDERVAIAIAADPAAYAQEGGEAVRERHARACKLLFEVGVEARQFRQERIVVIGEAVGHLVDYAEAGYAQQICLP
jgi:hypothetical protein